MTTLISNIYVIVYNLAIKTVHITHFYFIDNQCIIFVLFIV